MQVIEIYVNYANLCLVLTTLFKQINTSLIILSFRAKRKKTPELLQPPRFCDQDFVA